MASRALQPEPGEIEIVERRTVFCKAFRRPDGKIRVAAKVGPQHFPDNGQMIEIDDEPESADGIRWAARRVPYVLDWDADSVTLIYASKRGGGMRVRLLALDGAAFTKAIEAPRRVGNRIFVKVHAELEIELCIKAAGIEIFKRLLGPAAPTTIRWEIIEGDMTNIRYDPMKVLAHDNMLGLVSRPNDMLPRRRAECIVTKGPVTNLADGRIRYTVTERITGFTWQINEQTSSRTKLNEIAYPVVIDVTVTEDITDTADDGTGSATTWYTTNYTYTSTSGQRMAAWRWVTVDVPQGQTLDSATFSVNVTTNGSSGGCVLKGQNVDSADAWALSSSNTPVTMAATTASATFSPSGTGIKTLDVTSIVQEIINRAGWAANNNIRLGTTSPFSGGSVIFEDSQAAGTDEGQLVIVYTAGGSTPITGSDTGAGTGSTAIASSSTQGDTGSAAEGRTILVTLSGSETGSGAESTATTAIFGGAETGAGAEGTSTQAGASGADTGSGAESTATQAGATGADTGSGAESTSTQAGLTAADTGAGVDDGSVETSDGTATKSGSDSGAAAESTAIASSTTQGDTGGADESTAIDASTTQGDAAAGTESTAIAVPITAADTGGGVDDHSITVLVAVSDFGAAAEGVSIAGYVTGTDIGIATEGRIIVPFGGTAIISALRTYAVRGENRAYAVPEESRAYVIREENRTLRALQ